MLCVQGRGDYSYDIVCILANKNLHNPIVHGIPIGSNVLPNLVTDVSIHDHTESTLSLIHI